MAGTDLEGATLDHLMDELIQHLDLALFMDKLVSNGLIESGVLSQLDTLINSQGNRNGAVRKMLLAIRTNPPGYLETFVKILQDHPKTKYYGDRITAGVLLLVDKYIILKLETTVVGGTDNATKFSNRTVNIL